MTNSNKGHCDWSCQPSFILKGNSQFAIAKSWKMEKICKSTAQPMENRVLTFFFFFFGDPHGKILLVDMVASKIKKKGQHLVFHGWDCTFANLFRSYSKFSSAPKIKDNSQFNKGQGQGVQIKDCPLK